MTTTAPIESAAIVLRTPADLSPTLEGSLREAFNDYFEKADMWRQKALAINVNDASEKEAMREARTIRLALKDIRVAAEKSRKSMKEDSLRMGKAIDGCYNILEHAIVPLERHLQEQENFEERIKAERIQKLRDERVAQLSEFNFPVAYSGDVGTMSEGEFAALLADVKELAEARARRAREEQEAQLRREQEQAAERERVRVENERLKAEAQAREAQLKAERERAAAEKRAAEEQQRKEREAAAAKIREAEAERDRLQREADAVKAKEAARIKAEAAAARKAKRAPDADKIKALAQQIRALPLPTLSEDQGSNGTLGTIQSILCEAAKQIEELAANI